MTKIADGHEIKYWKLHKDDPYDRANIMIKMFDPIPYGIVADVGCGPRCGIFHSLSADTMYAVDPLWTEYIGAGLDVVPGGVELICSDAQNFKLPKLADFIVSINALDHSGDLQSSFDNIMLNLKPDGIFHFHVHMRTKKQLNKAHRMLITEEQVDSILNKYKILSKVIDSECRLDNKPYKSYIATVTR